MSARSLLSREWHDTIIIGDICRSRSIFLHVDVGRSRLPKAPIVGPVLEAVVCPVVSLVVEAIVGPFVVVVGPVVEAVVGSVVGTVIGPVVEAIVGTVVVRRTWTLKMWNIFYTRNLGPFFLAPVEGLNMANMAIFIQI